MLRSILAGILLLAGAPTVDGANAILARSRNSMATYASYQWIILRDAEGANLDGWSAEFHRGKWHRIENRWVHVLANCVTGDAHIYEISTGRTRQFRDEQNATCGITGFGDIESVVRLPSVSVKPFGRLDFIRVTDKKRIRHYQVDARGALVRVDWFQRDGSRYPCLIQEPLEISSVLPSPDLFSVNSLARTVTPEKYRHAPGVISSTGPSGSSCI